MLCSGIQTNFGMFTLLEFSCQLRKEILFYQEVSDGTNNVASIVYVYHCPCEPIGETAAARLLHGAP